MTAKPFQPLGHVDDFLIMRILVIGLLQIRLDVQRLVEGHLQFHRYQLGQLIRFGQRHIHHPADITNRRTGFHRSKGDNLCDMTVFAADVFEHPSASVLADVDIDIRHLGTLRVHKSLKQQIVANRVHIADAKAIPHHRSDGASSGAHGNIIGTGIIAEIPDNQKIAGKTLARNHLQLAFDTLPNFGSHGTILPFGTFVHQPGEIIFRRAAVRGGIFRRVAAFQVQFHIAPLCDLQR